MGRRVGRIRFAGGGERGDGLRQLKNERREQMRAAAADELVEPLGLSSGRRA